MRAKLQFFYEKSKLFCINRLFFVTLQQILTFITMTNKERYAEWCQKQAGMPIFMQPWWLDAVCAGKEWDVMLIENGELDMVNDLPKDAIVAAMPYLLRKRLWMRYIVMPQQTQIGGVWVDPSLGTGAPIHEVAHVIAARLEQMHLTYYYQQYPIGSPLPEQMRAFGFKDKERVTYRLDDLSNLDTVIDHFSKNKKRQLQKAMSLHAERGMSAEAFYRFHSNCLAERKRQASYSREFLLVLDSKAKRLGQCEVLSICNADGQVYAAAFLVWDKEHLYYLMPTFSMAHKDSGAGALLVLEAIKLAREKGVKFDFEGSMIHSIANHYKQFGAHAVTYASVSKLYKWWFWFALIYNRLRNLKYRI